MLTTPLTVNSEGFSRRRRASFFSSVGLPVRCTVLFTLRTCSTTRTSSTVISHTNGNHYPSSALDKLPMDSERNSAEQVQGAAVFNFTTKGLLTMFNMHVGRSVRTGARFGRVSPGVYSFISCHSVLTIHSAFLSNRGGVVTTCCAQQHLGLLCLQSFHYRTAARRASHDWCHITQHRTSGKTFSV